MSIVLPQVLVYQEFQSTPSELTDPLRAFLMGPEYKLHRYTTASEKVKAGEYDPINGNSFDWLSDLARLAGSTVDLSYTKVYIKDALLEYWATAAGIHSSNYAAPDATLANTPEDESNKIYVTGVNLVDSEDYPLDDAFNGRDVKVGDYVKASAIVNGTNYEAEGTIVALEATQLDTVIAAATSDDTNHATQALAITATTVTGAIDLTSLSAASYNGLLEGNISETYTITVLQSSTNGNPETLVLNIVSASGKDDVLGYVPTTHLWATAIPLGTLGATFKFNQTEGSNVTTAGKWTVAVTQAFTKPVATSSGTYTGTNDTTYIVEVISGGTTNGATPPVVRVTTSTGVDANPSVEVTGASGAQNLAVGNYGVVLNFNQVKLCAGDQYYTAVTAAADGPVRTIVLNKALPSALVSTSTDTVDLNLTLNIKKDMELHENLATLSVTNWEQDADTITILADAFEFDSTWDSGNTAIPLVGGDIYIHWRELVSTHTDKIYEITTLSDLSTNFTTQNDPDNPLVYAAYKALLNSGSATNPSSGIRVMGVTSDDVAGYTHCLGISEGREDLYTLVPLNQTAEVFELVAAHIASVSTPEIGLWRIGFVSVDVPAVYGLVTTNEDDSVVLATLNGSKILTLTNFDGDLVDLGVRANDIVRIKYSVDEYGTTEYSEFIVDSVLTESTLKTTTAPSPVVGTPSRVEIWRNTLAGDRVELAPGLIAAWKSSRMYNVFPTEVRSGGVYVPGYNACAAIAGLIGASAPQQGLTNVEVKGFDDMDNIIHGYSRSQLDTLANVGFWILTHDVKDGTVYTRHQLSTDTTDLNTRELSIVKNVDSISYFFKNRLKKYIGRSNVTQTAIDIIRTNIEGGIDYLATAGFSPLIGGQLNLNITKLRELRAHTILKDRIVCVIDLGVNYPNNNTELHLVV